MFNLLFSVNSVEAAQLVDPVLTGGVATGFTIPEWLANNAVMLNINSRNGIEYYDCLVDQAVIDAIPTVVSLYPSANVIGCWQQDGSVVLPLDSVGYLESMLDLYTFNADGTVASVSRPTQVNMASPWAGWAKRGG